MFFSHVLPLDLLVGLAGWKILCKIFEFIVDITSPSDALLLDLDFVRCLHLFLIQLECVIEKTLGDETAGSGWSGEVFF
jgi:hypothetical protein